MFPRESPNGHHLAYHSAESGRPEIYVRSLRDEGGRWQISTVGGRHPEWTRGGREIVFDALDGRLMAVTVTLEPTFAAGIPIFGPWCW